MDFLAFAAFAESLAEASGAVIRRYYRQGVAVDVKADDSPVTIADREAEEAIRAMIRANYPQHGIMGEEFGAWNPDAEWQWVIDPLDGTKSFMVGRPIFGTLIALAYQGEPVIGLIDQPVTGERWLGVKGQSATLNGKSIHSRPCNDLSQAVLCTTSPDLFSEDEVKRFQTLAKKVKYVIYGGDCYSYALVAMGLVDMVVESGLKHYDFAALAPVVTQAGGSFTDWRGNAMALDSGGQVIALGDARLLAEVTTILA